MKSFYLLFLLLIPIATGIQIIPENTYETDCLEICTKIVGNNNSNETLDCIYFFQDLKLHNNTETIHHNISNISIEEYIDKYLGNYTNCIKHDDLDEIYHNIDNKISDKFEEQEPKIIINDSDCSEGTKCWVDYQLELKRIENNVDTTEHETQLNSLRQDYEKRISDLLNANPPPLIEDKEPAFSGFADQNTLMFIGLVIVVGIIAYNKFKGKKFDDNFIPTQNKPPEIPVAKSASLSEDSEKIKGFAGEDFDGTQKS